MFFIALYFGDLLLNSVIIFHFAYHGGRFSFFQIYRENYCEVIPDVFHRFEFFRPPPELGS